MADPGRTYRSPNAAGAPQVGDVVVVVRAYTSGTTPGVVGRLDHIEEDPDLMEIPWHIVDGNGNPYGWAKAVRRPTEAELVSYHLSGMGTQ